MIDFVDWLIFGSIAQIRFCMKPGFDTRILSRDASNYQKVATRIGYDFQSSHDPIIGEEQITLEPFVIDKNRYVIIWAGYCARANLLLVKEI